MSEDSCKCVPHPFKPTSKRIVVKECPIHGKGCPMTERSRPSVLNKETQMSDVEVRIQAIRGELENERGILRDLKEELVLLEDDIWNTVQEIELLEEELEDEVANLGKHGESTVEVF